MSAMAPELLVAPLAVAGVAAQPGHQIEVGATFSLTFSAIGAPSIALEYRLPLGSLLIEVPDPVPVAAAGGAIDLPLEVPLVSERPRSKQWYLDWPEESPGPGMELLSIDVPAAESPGERRLTGSLLLPRDSIVIGHPLIADELISGPSDIGGCRIALTLDTVTGEATSAPDQSIRISHRSPRWVLSTAAVEVRLTFQPAIGLVYVRVPSVPAKPGRSKSQPERSEGDGR